jgi:hypothetical protein
MTNWSRIEKGLEGSKYGPFKLLSHHLLEENVFIYGCCVCYVSFVKSLKSENELDTGETKGR